eukprot:11884922-Alexandrium_andersonii.AAC.1
MSASLVGSEMCIRDSSKRAQREAADYQTIHLAIRKHAHRFKVRASKTHLLHSLPFESHPNT